MITLPDVFTIGFTGHRTLADEAASRTLIFQLLADLKASHSVLCGVASVAAGGDLIFAESCLALDLPLRVLLPLPAEEFRSDFDAATWERAERVIRAAFSVEITGTGGSRQERYYECGLETVQQSQLLLALWDGEPARGLGGTAQIIEFAHSLRRRVICIHSVTGSRKESGPREKSGDPELTFLNQLSEHPGASRESSPTAAAEAWLDKLDTNATHVAPQVKRLAALPIILTAIAAVVTAAAQHSSSADLLGVIGVVLGVLASVLVISLGLDTRRAHWIRIRTAAEVTRSVLAVWSTPARYQFIGVGVLPELTGMIRSLNFLKSQAARLHAPDVSSFKAGYLENRLLDQKNYFLTQSRKAARTARRYGAFSKLCIGVAVLILAWNFLSQRFFNKGHTLSHSTWIPLMTSSIFQLATIAGALVVVHDCNRREKRYRELYETLSLWESELRALQTWNPVLHVVENVERALLVELLEWRALFQNMKLPRN